jgi:hypothetical protein
LLLRVTAELKVISVTLHVHSFFFFSKDYLYRQIDVERLNAKHAESMKQNYNVRSVRAEIKDHDNLGGHQIKQQLGVAIDNQQLAFIGRFVNHISGTSTISHTKGFS